MNRKDHTMWTFPWRYRESIAILFGIVCVGFMLQATIGNFDFYLLHYPVNLIVGAILIVLIAALSFAGNNPIVKWLTGIPLSVSLIVTILVMTIMMGLIPQMVRVDPSLHLHWGEASVAETTDYIVSKIGLKQITTSWWFVLTYGFTLIVLAMVVARRLHRFKWRDWGFYLNHLGLWLFLFGAGFGAADMLRYVMYVEEGEVEWRVYDDREGEMLELDLAIELHDFVMEEYEPKLAVIDIESGKILPEKRPELYQIDKNITKTTLVDWDVEVYQYIPDAVRQSDYTFQKMPVKGSMPAARVGVSKKDGAEQLEGWVAPGSYEQFVQPLLLDDNRALVMTEPEPRRFASDVTVIVKDDSHDPIRTVIEVNKPLKIGSWTIYQYDYDQQRGKDSTVSGFELVYDPWLWVTYVGIIMLGIGSMAMIWFGSRKNNNNHNHNK